MTDPSTLKQADSSTLELISVLDLAVADINRLLTEARSTLALRLNSPTLDDAAAGVKTLSAAAIQNREQHALHGLAWLATYALSLEQLLAWAKRLQAAGQFAELESLIVQIGAGEYLAQIFGGIAMSQSEIIRLASLGLTEEVIDRAHTASVKSLIRNGCAAAPRARLASLLPAHQAQACIGASGLDSTLESMREQMRRFASVEVQPFAHEWHLKNEYIPMPVIEKMAELGVFALTVPEAYGGLGLGKK